MPSSLTSSCPHIPLMGVLAGVPDPRDPRGVRHGLAVVLSCAVGAVLAGSKSWMAVAEWVRDADRDALRQLGISPDTVLPSESTIRRTLAQMDADDLDRRVGAWVATRTAVVAGRRVIAVDGKSLRGAGHGGLMPHLLAALDHHRGVVVAQQAVSSQGDKGSEIPALRQLLGGMDLRGVVVTADALHCQRETATWITGRGGDYVMTVKGNQPGLLRILKTLPWKDVPAHTHRQSGHGRRVRRTVRAVTAPGWLQWPAAAQVVQFRRTRTVKGRKHIEVAYVISSVPMVQARPSVIATWIQGHWAIENALHWVRDVVFDEDHHQLRVGAGPQVMATLRNTAISLLRLTGWSSIAAGLRHHARDSRRPIELLAAS